MIQPHLSYKFPSEDTIASALERCGYEYYLPEDLFTDLINLYAHYFIEGEPVYSDKKFVVESQKEFYNKLDEFYRSLKLELYAQRNPLDSAIYTLKSLSKVINFRLLEKFDPEFDEPKELENYKEVLDKKDVLLIDDRNDIDKMDTVAEIINLSTYIADNITMRPGEDTIESTGKIVNVKDILKVKKSSLVRSDLGYKLARKDLVISKDISISKDKSVLVYLEDASISMTENRGYVISKAIQRLLAKDNREIHYYRYVSKNIECYKLKTFEDKLQCFKEDKSYYKSPCDYYSLLQLITQKYKNGHVIIATDGQDSVPLEVKTNLTFHCISPSRSISMNRFIKSTGGKYIII